MNPSSPQSDRITERPRIDGMTRHDIARVAHAAVEKLDFLEMNDGNRMAYHLYLFLSGQIQDIPTAIEEAKPRLAMSYKDLALVLSDRLAAAGVA